MPPERLKALRLRAELYALIRTFFSQRGVLEVETPMLSAAGNTDPNIDSFTTAFNGHVDAGAAAAALDGGEDGLDPYRVIAADAAGHLKAKGIVAVEIGYDQAEGVTALFEAAGFGLIELRNDLGGRDRALACAWQ